MTSRDERLAARYAAEGRESATEAKQRKETARAERGSRKTPAVAEDPMEGMRRALRQPRTQDSIDRAQRHKRSLPPLGGAR